MASISKIEPDVLILEFNQDESDKDYGSCLWARFYIDKKSYTLTIDSDCGHYAYSWLPTKSESFIHLLSRMNKDYFLSKISEDTYVDSNKTFILVNQYLRDITPRDEYKKLDLHSIKDVCSCRTIAAVTSELKSTIPYHIACNIDEFELFNSIVTIYPPQAQTIAEIFMNYVIPYLRLKESDGEI